MAKKRSVPNVPSRKQLSRKAREERQQRMLYGGAAILGVVIVAIVGFGVYDVLLRQPRRAVATVAGVPIRNDYYQKMVAYRQLNLTQTIYQIQDQLKQLDSSDENSQYIAQYYQQEIDYYNSLVDQAPSQVLEDLIDSELVRQGATALGITVTDDDIQKEIQTIFGYDPNPPTATPTPITSTLPITVTPTATTAPMTEAQFQQSYSDYVSAMIKAMPASSHFTEQDFRDMVRDSVLRTKLQDKLAEDMPTTAMQVKASHILVATEDEAKAVLARLQAGEDFATVAKEVSIDTSTAEQGGELGWFGTGVMDPAFEKVAFNTPPGQISDIVQTSYGYHIIKVEEKDDNHPLDASTLEQQKSTLVDDWLQEQRTSTDIARLIEFPTPTPEPTYPVDLVTPVAPATTSQAEPTTTVQPATEGTPVSTPQPAGTTTPGG